MQANGPVMLMRHAEKAQEGECAVDLRGHADANSLSVRGWMRAASLVRLFMPPAINPHLVSPRHLLAARATAARPSTRPRDTLQPLAQALNLEVDERFSTEDPPAEVAAYLHRLEGPVLVCWRHDGLPALANELLQRVAAPTRWPERSFDMLWVIEQARLSWELVPVPQRLLPGDTTQAGRRVAARR